MSRKLLKTLLPTAAVSTTVFVAAVIFSLVEVPSAQPSGASTTAVYNAFAFESLTVSTTALGVTTATAFPTSTVGARLASCTTETDAVRYRYDGGNPTSSVGHAVAANATLLIYGATNIRNFRVIRSGSADATLRCTFAR